MVPGLPSRPAVRTRLLVWNRPVLLSLATVRGGGWSVGRSVGRSVGEGLDLGLFLGVSAQTLAWPLVAQEALPIVDRSVCEVQGGRGFTQRVLRGVVRRESESGAV